MVSKFAGAAALVLMLAACAPTAVQQPLRPVAAPTRLPAQSGLDTVLGRTVAALTAQFGTATLDVREGDARKLQFASALCVLDAYLYPPAVKGEPIVTHIDARRLDGSDFDRASCIAALQAQKQVR